MKVKCGKDTIEVAVEDLDMTVRALKENLAEITNYTDIKLILAGKVIKDEDATIGSLPGGLHAKLTMMGSTAAAIESIKNAPSINNKRIIDDLSGEPNSKPGASSSASDNRSRQYNPYKFERIQTLPGLPNEDKAREILQSLANDEGVLAVMKKHKWSVGALCELYPEGYVGVSDVCVMGLNENHGQRILLRLRTDDMKGFRKILSIRKVLCHELAHNEHSEHDDKFYVLMRQVEREIAELDWKNTKGRALSGSEAPGPVYQPSAHSSTTPAGPMVHRLGGSTDPLVQQFVPARYLAASAAIMRITAEEKEIEDHCGSSPRTTDQPNTTTSGGRSSEMEVVRQEDADVEQVAAGVDRKSSGDATRTEGQQSDFMRDTSAVDEGLSHASISTVPGLASLNPEVADPSAMGGHDESLEAAVGADAPVKVAAPPDFAAAQHAVLSAIDDSIAFALSTESAAAPVERLLALRDALCEIMDHFDRTAQPAAKIEMLQRCLQILLKIVSNAKDHSEEKYRRIKKSSQVFQRDVASIPGALPVLLSAGFANEAEVVVLTRNDPGLLYVVASILQSSLDILQTYF